MNLLNIVEKCPKTMSGADFYALASDSLLNALKRRIDEVDNIINSSNGKYSSARTYLMNLPVEQLQITLKQEDFQSALSKLTPSLSVQELEHYKKLQRQFAAKGPNTIKK